MDQVPLFRSFNIMIVTFMYFLGEFKWIILIEGLNRLRRTLPLPGKRPHSGSIPLPFETVWDDSPISG